MSSAARNSRPGQHSRSILSKLDDSGPQQLVEVTALADQTIGDAVRVLHGGFSSVPPKGAEGLALMLGGGADRTHVLGLEHPEHRPRNRPEGASWLYQTNNNKNHAFVEPDQIEAAHDKKIVLKVGSNVTITIVNDTVTIEAPNVKIKGKVEING